MKIFALDSYLIEGTKNKKMQLFFASIFPFLVIIGLHTDSSEFLKNNFDGRNIINIVAVIYYILIFSTSDSTLRKLMFIMVPLSYIGELIFSNLLGFYNYRTESIPMYVPFGHAIVYSSGVIYSQTSWSKKNEKVLKKIFFVCFSLLLLSVVILLNDQLSLIFGILFFLILKRKRWDNMYYFIAICVIFIELVGTYFRCWTWRPYIFNTISTANPPIGAIFLYAGGDILLIKVTSYWKSKHSLI
jgi:hypothetical protein